MSDDSGIFLFLTPTPFQFQPRGSAFGRVSRHKLVGEPLVPDVSYSRAVEAKAQVRVD